jgi:ribA/ribD-fused uncharacterized protein
MSKTAAYFYGHTAGKPYKSFSNFYPSRFSMLDQSSARGDVRLDFFCSEQALMWHKAMVMGDPKTASLILQASEPRKCKQLGRMVANFDDKLWTERRHDVMVRILTAKFGQNPELMEELLSTGEREIAEASPSDRVWGIGLNVADAQRGLPWRGTNVLGQALEETRATLQQARVKADQGQEDDMLLPVLLVPKGSETGASGDS